MIISQVNDLKRWLPEIEGRVLAHCLSFEMAGKQGYIVGCCFEGGQPIGVFSTHQGRSIKIWKTLTSAAKAVEEVVEDKLIALTLISSKTSSPEHLDLFLELYGVNEADPSAHRQLELERKQLVKDISADRKVR